MIPAEHLVARAETVVVSASDNIWKIWKWFGDLFRGERMLLPVQFEAREAAGS